MKKNKIRLVLFLIAAGLPVFFNGTTAQENNGSTDLFSFSKKELNKGLVFNFNSEREELRTSFSREYEELKAGAAKFRWENRNWNYLSFKTEQWNYLLEAGPFLGKGSFIDSSSTQAIDASHKLAGLRGKAAANYSGRFYYDERSFTLVSMNAWGRYDWYQQNAEGTLVDSNQVSNHYDEIAQKTKFRYGFQAKAGWGTGRLNPVNHYMASAWFLENFYPGRLFSVEEISRAAREIGRIKHRRNARAGHSAKNELEQFVNFLRQNMLLEAPADALDEWELTEFRPRFSGSRFGIGPFFNYFNREPDFIFGGYAQYENEKYINTQWHRSLGANLNYNSYKDHDWILLESTLGWSWYPNLRSEYSFGLKYVPGMKVNGIDDLGPVRHNFIPYVNYYSQLSSSYRMDLAFSWRIAANDTFVLPGPEVSVSFYRSRY